MCELQFLNSPALAENSIKIKKSRSSWFLFQQPTIPQKIPMLSTPTACLLCCPKLVILCTRSSCASDPFQVRRTLIFKYYIIHYKNKKTSSFIKLFYHTIYHTKSNKKVPSVSPIPWLIWHLQITQFPLDRMLVISRPIFMESRVRSILKQEIFPATLWRVHTTQDSFSFIQNHKHILSSIQSFGLQFSCTLSIDQVAPKIFLYVNDVFA